MNILIVENDLFVASFIRRILQNTLPIHLIDIAPDFEEGFTKALSNTFDIILIDILLGDDHFDGIELCKSIRKSNNSIPLIIITSCSSVTYLERGFEAGANDYITKPFRPKELVSRVKRWFSLRGTVCFEPEIRYGSLLYCAQTNEFFCEGELITLPKKQKNLLRIFFQHAGRLLSASFVKERFWGDYSDSERKRNIRSNIHLLRRNISPLWKISLRTVRGEGYILEAR